MRLFKQLLGVFAAVMLIITVLAVFAFDVVKIDWIVFMEIQDSFGTQEKPLAVPAQSVPVEGAAYIPGVEPTNPVTADEVSVSRGAQLFSINCSQCHGIDGTGSGTIAAFLVKKKPADLTGEAAQGLSDGQIFMTITDGVFNAENSLFPDVEFSGQCPPLNENLSVRERWDVVNYVRTLGTAQP
ncbi:MAG: cytochrome c [Chloroflexi bacterium]|nr:cytochrome c [Chloroflexota bacterium]